MKKLLLSLLAVVFSLNIGIVSAMAGSMELPQDDSESFGLKDNILITSGEIKSIENGRIRVTGDGNYDDIILNMSATVPILNGETGQDVPFKDLKKGKKVVAYYGPFVTRSLPPQGNAVAVVIQAEEPLDTGIYLEVGKVLPNNDDSIRVLSTNEDQLITLGKDVITRLDSIQEGTRLVVWYKMMAMSMPGQATAVKAIVLPPVMKVHLGTGVIVLQGKELPLGVDDKFIFDQQKTLIPLNSVVKSLGYGIYINQDTNLIEILDGFKVIATLAEGDVNYQKSGTNVKLPYAPEINGNTIAVPAEFFDKILGLKVEVLNSHI